MPKPRPISQSASLRIASGSIGHSTVRRGLFAPRLGGNDLALITRQLTALVASVRWTNVCKRRRQTRKASTKALLLQVRSKVLKAIPLCHGAVPQTFGDMYRAMVNAGEQAGQLGPVLDQLADYTESRQHTSQKLQMALIYPFVLIGVAIAVVTALMIVCCPRWRASSPKPRPIFRH